MTRRTTRIRIGLLAAAAAAAHGCVGDEGPPAPRVHTVRRGPVRIDALPESPNAPDPMSLRPELLLESHTEQVVPVSNPTLDARLLVVSANGQEPALSAIRQALDYYGVPYTLWVATERPGALTPAALWQASHGRYQGVVLTTGALAYSADGVWRSALSAEEWQALWDYEAAFRVRQVTWYTYPTADYGFDAATAVDTSTTPLSGTLTSAGRGVFTTVNASRPLGIRGVWAYRARPVVSTSVVPLVTEATGAALVLQRTWPDGRQNLAMTFDGGATSVHTLALAYGVVNWVTRGLFLGERHVYVGAQVDDFFFPNDLYTGGEYRMSGTDLERVRAWQSARRARPVTAALRLDMVFNGEGASGSFDADTLTPVARQRQGDFKWINHTWSHMNLDAVTYGAARDELTSNLAMASTLRFSNFAATNLVTGEISGLRNLAAMQAAWDVGVRYLVSDSSRPEGAPLSPNTGRPNAVVPGIFEIPRRPTNLFYNVSTPTEWAAEYNAFYRSYWGRDLTYAEILDRESDVLLQYLLRGESSPWMFHQSNLRAYDGSRTLLGDLLDAAFTKYEAILTLPIVSPTMNDLALRTLARGDYNACGAAGVLRPGRTLVLTAARACTIPVTGVSWGSSRENYGGQPISYVRIRAGETLSITL